MNSSGTLPMMLPLRIRNRSDHDTLFAQEQYLPFRPTPFDQCDLDDGAKHGPGALFRDEWNSLATRAQQMALSLYKTERDVNPTIPPVVDATYRTNDAHDLAIQMAKKGNVATMLKSPRPRFPTEDEDARVGSTKGPGDYSPERFTGAFPALSERVTPSRVREEKLQAHLNFDRTFAILPTTTRSPRTFEPSAPVHGAPLRVLARLRSSSCEPTKIHADHPEPQGLQGLQSTPLKPALTPRNVYSHQANRELVLRRTKM